MCQSLRALVLVLAATACDGGAGTPPGDDGDSDTDTDADTDSDTDTDTDTDTDADSDTDTDTDTELNGEIAMRVRAPDGELLCDADIWIAGAPYVGDCPTCELSFEIDATIGDESVAGCASQYGFYAGLLASADVPHRFLRFDDSDGAGSYDVLSSGWSVFPTDVPTWTVISSEGWPGQWASYGDGALDWALDYADESVCLSVVWTPKLCGPYDGSSVEEHTGAYASTDSVRYRTEYDQWAIDATEDGYATISVDTVSVGAAFVPQLTIIDLTGCIIGGTAFDFPCTFTGHSDQCPSYRLPVTAGETYRIFVLSQTTSRLPMGDYKIVVDAPFDPALRLEGDDQPICANPQIELEGTAVVH